MHGKTTLRFFVAEMAYFASQPDASRITLKPAYNNGKGNEAWASATPSGEMTIHVNNPNAVEWFSECMRDKSDIHITMERVEDL